MQIFEKSALGLRAARITLKASGKTAFTLFPMKHVADRAFFEAVGQDADQHDLVLCEGVDHPIARSFSRSHRAISAPENGLARQSEVMGPMAGPHWENSDVSPEEFEAALTRVPAWRLALAARLLPLAGYLFRFHPQVRMVGEGKEGRRSWAEGEHGLEWLGGVPLREAVLNIRDRALAKRCDAAIQDRNLATVAVIWGAEHIPPLVRHLSAGGYVATWAEWMTVIRS